MLSQRCASVLGRFAYILSLKKKKEKTQRYKSGELRLYNLGGHRSFEIIRSPKKLLMRASEAPDL